MATEPRNLKETEGDALRRIAGELLDAQKEIDALTSLLTDERQDRIDRAACLRFVRRLEREHRDNAVIVARESYEESLALEAERERRLAATGESE